LPKTEVFAMRITIVTDTHLAERASGFVANWRAATTWLDATAPDLIIHLGDITADGASNPAELTAAAQYFAGLKAPIRFLPGNHDIGDNPIAPGIPNKHPLHRPSLDEYRRVFGPDRWSIEAGGWQLVGLNAQLFGTDDAEEAEQFAWLRSVLDAGFGPLGLLLHKPLFRDRPDHTDAHIRYVPALPRRRLLDLLAGRDLRFVVAGHTHQLRRHALGAVEHVWAPSTACIFPDAIQETIGKKVVGTLLLDLAADSHRFEPVEPPGLAQHNLFDHPHVYPEIAATKARLEAEAAR
jgi:3',5'-cyclic AMP phosphodiesterase CpdA